MDTYQGERRVNLQKLRRGESKQASVCARAHVHVSV